MLTVKEAANILGVTPARVRKMIYDGVLPGEKFGSNWSIPKIAVINRSVAKQQSGRPKKDVSKRVSQTTSQAAVIGQLYKEVKEGLIPEYSIDALLQLETTEEREFYVTIADFFLQQKQRQLIKEGVF